MESGFRCVSAYDDARHVVRYQRNTPLRHDNNSRSRVAALRRLCDWQQVYRPPATRRCGERDSSDGGGIQRDSISDPASPHATRHSIASTPSAVAFSILSTSTPPIRA